MEKTFQGILLVIVGSILFSMSYVLTHVAWVGGEKGGHILHPHHPQIPPLVFIFLFFGGIALIVAGLIVITLYSGKEKA